MDMVAGLVMGGGTRTSSVRVMLCRSILDSNIISLFKVDDSSSQN